MAIIARITRTRKKVRTDTMRKGCGPAEILPILHKPGAGFAKKLEKWRILATIPASAFVSVSRLRGFTMPILPVPARTILIPGSALGAAGPAALAQTPPLALMSEAGMTEDLRKQKTRGLTLAPVMPAAPKPGASESAAPANAEARSGSGTGGGDAQSKPGQYQHVL